MTHHALSKSAGSSRARPSKAIIEQVRNDPWGPVAWGKNEPGMQANTQLEGEELQQAYANWHWLARKAADGAEVLMNNGLHKQICNRPLEPYTFIDVVLTGTEFNNFFALRVHEAADPTIYDLAKRMQDAMANSTPKLLGSKCWHLPFINEDDYIMAEGFIKERDQLIPNKEQLDEVLLKVSVARCARTSYKAFDGKVASIEQDLDLYNKLIMSQPMHASPAEHQARPDILIADGLWANRMDHGNLVGWRQYRKMLPNEYVPG